MIPRPPSPDRARGARWPVPAALATAALVISWLCTACAAPPDSAGESTASTVPIATADTPAASAPLPTYAHPPAACTGVMFPPFDYRGDSLFVAERAVMSAAGAVTREGPELRIVPGGPGGRNLPALRFRDCRADDGEMNVRFVYQGTGPAGRGHLLLRGHYEGADVLWVSDSTGVETVLPVLPVLAPDGAHFVIANADLESGYTPNTFELWAVRGSDITRVVAVPMPATAGAAAPVWEDAGAVRADLVEAGGTPAGSTASRRALRLRRRGERWVLDTIPPPVPPTR